MNNLMTKPKWKEAKKILERMNYDEDYAYSYEFEDVGIITESFDEINKENTNIKKQLDKANDRIYELGKCIKHLQGSNKNKQNRIKNLESKLEEYKSIDDVMNLDLDEFLCYFQKLTKDVNNGVEEMLLGDNTIIIVAWFERFKKMLNQF